MNDKLVCNYVWFNAALTSAILVMKIMPVLTRRVAIIRQDCHNSRQPRSA